MVNFITFNYLLATNLIGFPYTFFHNDLTGNDYICVILSEHNDSNLILQSDINFIIRNNIDPTLYKLLIVISIYLHLTDTLFNVKRCPSSIINFIHYCVRYSLNQIINSEIRKFLPYIMNDSIKISKK